MSESKLNPFVSPLIFVPSSTNTLWSEEDLPLSGEGFKISSVKKAMSDANKMGLKASSKVIAKVDEKRPHTGIRDGIANLSNFNSGFNIRSKVSNTLKKAMNTSSDDIFNLTNLSNLSSHTPRSFTQIPQSRPATPLLDRVESPADLKSLTIQDLLTLADELREYLLYSVGVSGGHFGANLGVVELTIALHYLLNTPQDQLLWDVGHQAYAHKALTGRRDQLPTIRSKGGLTAFPERSESVYDAFGVGHSSTVISAGLGMSLANRLRGESDKVACVVGDGAMTAGMAFEAMNDAVHNNADLLVVLNDNDMSISTATGGFAKHLSTLWHAGYQVNIDEQGEPKIRIRPDMNEHGKRSRHLSEDNETPISVDNLFRAIGFSYFGPFDGHDLPELVRVLELAKQLSTPVLVHVYTNKGKGFEPAEVDPVGFHAIGKVAKKATVQADQSIKNTINNNIKESSPTLKYSQVFGQFICDKALVDKKLLAVTPAMESGSGMTAFAKQFPKRFFDVAIAEQHAVTLAAGMATQGLKPIVAIYSSFLQRGYDQLVHDVALQNLDVTFAIDRAGLVGEDGATHAGVFDYAFMRCLPNVVIACPKDENECYHLLNTCYEYQGVSAVRYPRGVGVGAVIDKQESLDTPKYAVGKAVIESVYDADNSTQTGSSITNSSHADVTDRTTAKKLAILAFGTMTATADSVAKRLVQTTDRASSVMVVNMRWVKPLDTDMIDGLIAQGVTHIATLEEHSIMGGAGSAVNEYLLAKGLAIKVKNLGIPDRYIAHASHQEQLADCGLDAEGVFNSLNEFIAK